MSQFKIQELSISLWGKYHVNFKANEDVNIIVGINGSGKTTLLNEINKIPMISHEEEVELAQKAQTGDKAAKNKLVNANLRCVVNVAKK